MNIIDSLKPEAFVGLPVVGVSTNTNLSSPRSTVLTGPKTGTVRIDWSVEPTTEQVAAAQAVLDAHDPAAYEAERAANELDRAALVAGYQTILGHCDTIETRADTLINSIPANPNATQTALLQLAQGEKLLAGDLRKLVKGLRMMVGA